MKTLTSSRFAARFGGLVRWPVRIALVLAALVFFVSLLTVATGLLAVWGVRALWARLTGKPVTPWVFRVDPRAHWSGFGQPPARGPLSQGGGGTQRGRKEVMDVSEVTDVIARDIKSTATPTDR